MPTTLSDIARAMGVSKMTVSRAINNHPTINHETRERVLAVAQRMRYEPNIYARALVTNRSNLLGIVVPDLMHSYFAEIIKGVGNVASAAGFQILICSTEEDAGKESEEVRALLHRTDGIIVASTLPPDESKAYRKLLKENAKIVLVDRGLRDLPCPLVSVDNVKVGMLATEHLINVGYEQIGHLRGGATTVADDRYEGYRRALKKHRRSFDRSLVRDSGFLESDGYETMRRWIARGAVPRAIFAGNDPAAIGAIRALDEAGRRVPEDVALVGAGDIHYGDMLKVPLTTVGWNTLEMGKQAARLIIEMIEGSGDGAQPSAGSNYAEPELIVRKSCGAA